MNLPVDQLHFWFRCEVFSAQWQRLYRAVRDRSWVLDSPKGGESNTRIYGFWRKRSVVPRLPTSFMWLVAAKRP